MIVCYKCGLVCKPLVWSVTSSIFVSIDSLCNKVQKNMSTIFLFDWCVFYRPEWNFTKIIKNGTFSGLK